MVRNRAATFQAEVAIDEGEDGPGSLRERAQTASLKVSRKEVQITQNFSGKDSDQNIEFEAPEGVGGSGRRNTVSKSRVRAATFEKLLEKMTSAEYFPEDDLLAFLTTHDLYITTEDLLKALTQRSSGMLESDPARIKYILSLSLSLSLSLYLLRY